MAFKFGSTPSSTPSLFGSSAPAFGSAASTPSLFGSSSPSLFGGGFGAPGSSAAQGSSLFGASTGGLFGAPAGGAVASSTPSLFGAQNTGASLFGAASTPSLFGASAPSLFAPAQGGFNPAPTLNLFGAQSSNPAQGGGLFGGGFGQQNQQQVVNPGGIATTDNKPITHYTRWSDINAAGQAQLLELETRILQTKEESRLLSACERLRQGPHDEPGEAEALSRHCLKGVTGSRQTDTEAIAVLGEKVQELLRSTEVAVRTFERAYTWREVSKLGQRQVIPAAVRDMINSPVTLPSHFLSQAVHSFKETIEQCRVVVEELDRLLSNHRRSPQSHLEGDSAQRVVEMLPGTLRNIEDYLMRNAAKISRLQDSLALMKDKFLDGRRQDGDYRDPFKIAERKERHRASDSEQTRQSVIPPAGSPSPGPSASGHQPLLLTAGGPPLGQVPSIFGQAALPSTALGSALDAGKQSGSRKTKKR